MAVSVIVRLVNQSKGLCHYCKRRTNRVVGSPLQATREHVVPRSMGGANNISNYVLACAECNGKRGTALFYCGCDHCSDLIGDALETQEFIDKVFEGIVKHHRVKVFYDIKARRWATRQGHVNRHFDTWEQAIRYSREGTFMRGE